MAKIGNPNQRSKYKALNARLARYVVLVQQMYDAYNLEAAKLATSVNYGMEKPFRFSDFPTTTKRLDDILTNWRKDLSAIITTGTAKEWGNSNLTQDMLADKALAYYYGKSHGRRVRRYYQKNSDALKAFQTRVDNGMNLSQKIWDQSRNYKTELEAAVSAGIQKGMSAVTLSKRVSKYLNDFDQLKKDYKERYGREVDCLNCEYRSIRLARSEINMAYRTAEQERWKQFDFVLGYEIKLSQQHDAHMPHGDICDDLKGKYPKDFKWTGWHPNDMCYVVPILKTEEEFFADDDTPTGREVSEPPKNFTDWLNRNAERIDKSAERNTLPYWYKDNEKYVRMAEQYVDYPQFHTCKTQEEYAQLAETLPFVRSVRYEDCSLPASAKITKTLFDLGKEFELPMEDGGLDIFTWFEDTKGKSKTGSLGSFDRFGKQKIGIASDSDRIINRQVAKQKSNMLKREKEMIAQTEKNIEALKQTIKENSYMGDDPWLVGQKDLLARAEGYHKQLVSDLAEKEKGFIPSLDTTARKLEDVVTHEFGHFVNDNIRRNWELYPERVKEVIIKIEKELGYVADRPNRIWEFDSHFLDSVAFEKGRQISFYASTEGCEYFAEAFVTYCKTGTSKNELLDELFNALKRI